MTKIVVTGESTLLSMPKYPPPSAPYQQSAIMGADASLTKHGSKRDTSAKDRNRARVATGGVVIVVAAATWFAFGKQYLTQRKLKSMETLILTADNGAEAHIRPLGCCIQSMPDLCPCRLRLMRYQT